MGGHPRDLIMSGDDEIVRMLIEAGADVMARDGDGATPLHYAASTHSLDVVKRLLTHGVDINAVDNEGRTPLWEANFRGAIDVSEILVSHGARSRPEN